MAHRHAMRVCALRHDYTPANWNIRTRKLKHPYEVNVTLDMAPYGITVITEMQVEAEKVTQGRSVEVFGMPSLDGFFYATVRCQTREDAARVRERFKR